jgi:hypothetical protein
MKISKQESNTNIIQNELAFSFSNYSEEEKISQKKAHELCKKASGEMKMNSIEIFSEEKLNTFLEPFEFYENKNSDTSTLIKLNIKVNRKKLVCQ